MLNKPKYLIPSANTEECVVDLMSDNIYFSCIVDGNEAIYCWRIKIYKINDNKLVFNTGKITLNSPFYPINEKNENVLFKLNLKEYLSDTSTVYSFPADSVYNEKQIYYTKETIDGKVEYKKYEYNKDTWSSDYKSLYYFELRNSDESFYWIIDFWNYKDRESQTPTTTSNGEVFFANTTPALSISYSKNNIDYININSNPVEESLTSREYYFKGSYESLEDVQLKKYGWKLIDVDNNQILIDTISKNNIYGVKENILCSYKGFLNNNKYSIQLFVETQNNFKLLSEPYEFTISYETTALSNDFKVELLKNEPSVMLDWSDSIVISGSSNGEIEFLSNYPIVGTNDGISDSSVHIKKDSSIVFEYGSNTNIDISEDSYIVLSTQLLSDSSTILFSAEGFDSDNDKINRVLSYDNGVFTYSFFKNLKRENNNIISTHSVKNRPNKYVWYVITMSPLLIDEENIYYVKLTVKENVTQNGIIPDNSLYPSTDETPSFGEWVLYEEV